MPYHISPARSPADVETARLLFNAYAASLDIDLCFQGFAEELAELPGRYATPAGELLLARGDRVEPLGCVALRPITAGCCEMKRLFVSPEARGLGRALVEAIVAEAERIGYREMRLDTLPSMAGAVALYRKSGFEPIEPYYYTPVAGTIFLSRRLGG
jgi:GNAT superfamily N-acetyltransferase